MRRIPILLSLVIVLAFALASCADAGEGNQTPGTTDSFDQTPMPGVTDVFPEVTEPIVTETEVVETQPAVTDIAETPTVDVTEPVLTDTPEAAETEELPPTGMLDANRLSVLIDFDVVTQDGEQVGEVDDFILNLTNTKIDYVIVDSATFLDIGGRKIAVPWESFEVRPDDENVFVLKFNRDVFEGAPDFDADVFPAIGDEVADWDLYLTDYWDAAGSGTSGTSTSQATATPGSDTATADATDEAGQTDKGRVKGTVLASDLLGMNLVSEDGESFGEIQDAIVNLENGKVKYLVVSIDTADGTATHLLVIPALVLRYDNDGQAFGFTVDRATVDEAPFFENDEWPDTGISSWDDQILAYWRDFVDGLDDD